MFKVVDVGEEIFNLTSTMIHSFISLFELREQWGLTVLTDLLVKIIINTAWPLLVAGQH